MNRPQNIVGTVFLVGFTQSSDFFRERSLHVVVPLLITMIGNSLNADQ
jgi:hypothetical protein